MRQIGTRSEYILFFPLKPFILKGFFIGINIAYLNIYDTYLKEGILCMDIMVIF